MNQDTKNVIVGAVATAVSALCADVLTLPAIDPEHFTVWTRAGILHNLEVVGVFVIIAEARYWAAWSKRKLQQLGINNTGGTQ